MWNAERPEFSVCSIIFGIVNSALRGRKLEQTRRLIFLALLQHEFATVEIGVAHLALPRLIGATLSIVAGGRAPGVCPIMSL